MVEALCALIIISLSLGGFFQEYQFSQRLKKNQFKVIQTYYFLDQVYLTLLRGIQRKEYRCNLKEERLIISQSQIFFEGLPLYHADEKLVKKGGDRLVYQIDFSDYKKQGKPFSVSLNLTYLSDCGQSISKEFVFGLNIMDT